MQVQQRQVVACRANVNLFLNRMRSEGQVVSSKQVIQLWQKNRNIEENKNSSLHIGSLARAIETYYPEYSTTSALLRTQNAIESFKTSPHLQIEEDYRLSLC